jgi:hypothetical protein
MTVSLACRVGYRGRLADGREQRGGIIIVKDAMQSAGPLLWLLGMAALVAALVPGAWLLRALVARVVGARPAFGAALWSVVFALIVWAMLAVIALMVSRGSAVGSGAPFLALAMVLSWCALSLSVRLYLPDPAGLKLPWPRALWVSLAPVLLLWAELLLAWWWLMPRID